MKILHFFPILLLLACNSDDLEVAFQMIYPDIRFEIPVGLNTLDSHYFIQRDIRTNQDIFFGDIEEDVISEIVPVAARLVPRNGNSINFGFIDEISIRICREDFISEEEAVQACNTEIFYRENIPLNAIDEVLLLPNIVNAKQWLVEERFSFLVVLKRLRSTSATTTPVQLELTFNARR